MSRIREVVLARLGRRAVITSAIALVVALVAGTVGYYVFIQQDTYRLTAEFRGATPGLYPGNSVDILGVPTGTIDSVTPKAEYVEVVMSLPAGVRVPAAASAVLMAPNPVSDRFVELTPAYTHGAALAANAVIPPRRTFVPLELDAIYGSVDNFAKMLGPGGANAHGELSSVLHAFAQLANGTGADLHSAIEKIAAALPALTAHPDDLKNLVTGLDRLTSTLAAHDATINSLYDDLATATGQLADERQTLSTAVDNLQQGLAQVAAFIRANQAHLGRSLKNLNTTVAAIMAEQKGLIQTFDTAPLGFQNFNRAIDPNAPCVTAAGDGGAHNCTALWGRLDTTSDADSFLRMYCGNLQATLVPILASNAHLAKATATDTACGAQTGLLQGRTGPPGSPKTPDLDLTHYLGSR